MDLCRALDLVESPAEDEKEKKTQSPALAYVRLRLFILYSFVVRSIAHHPQETSLHGLGMSCGHSRDEEWDVQTILV